MEYIENVFSDLLSQFGSAFPKIVGAIVLLIVGIIIAKIIKSIIGRMLSKSGIDNINKNSKSAMSISATIAKIVYLVLLIYVFIFVLSMLGISGALDPLKNMLSEIMGYIPNIIAAGLIGYIGYMLANIAKEAVGLVASGLDDVGERYGIRSTMNLAEILKQVVFLFILIPIILVALDTLNISTISDPAKHMLQTLFDAIPNIIAAAIILFVFLFGGKFLTSIVRDLLKNLNIDKASAGLGLSSFIGEKYTLSDIIAKILYFFIAFFGIVTAVEKLEFAGLSQILYNVLGLTGNILFGMIILIIGNRISQFVSNYFAQSDAPVLSSIGRFATLGLFLAIALMYMGIADDIVNLAFGLTLGSVAVAFALSFGLGGREAAGKQMERFLNRFDQK